VTPTANKRVLKTIKGIGHHRKRQQNLISLFSFSMMPYALEFQHFFQFRNQSVDTLKKQLPVNKLKIPEKNGIFIKEKSFMAV